MAEKPESVEDAKGRIKEAAGNLTGDDKTRREGKIEQAGEKLKGGVDRATEKAKELLHDSDRD